MTPDSGPRVISKLGVGICRLLLGTGFLCGGFFRRRFGSRCFLGSGFGSGCFLGSGFGSRCFLGSGFGSGRFRSGSLLRSSGFAGGSFLDLASSGFFFRLLLLALENLAAAIFPGRLAVCCFLALRFFLFQKFAMTLGALLLRLVDHLGSLALLPVKPLLELLDPTRRVDEGLLAGVEGV